jgi:hypothetical protein
MYKNRTAASLFDRKALSLKPLSERRHDLDLSIVKQLDSSATAVPENSRIVAGRIIRAKEMGASSILMMGGHVIRSGIQRYVIDLMQRGYITCLAMNGGAMIHDFELSLIGATTESVADYIKTGQFGLWNETGYLNDIINKAYLGDGTVGMGYAVGQAIFEGDFPYKDISLLASAYSLEIPITVHVGIGYDIIHEHPNCDGAATGALSYNDFLKFTSILRNLQGGVVMNFGSAVMAPEIFLKALSMARNAAHQKGRIINDFTTLVCDIRNLPANPAEEPPKDEPLYYFRPWKTMLTRTVADGGQSFYIRGKHSDTFPSLWAAIQEEENTVKD